jgi:hypothetical protein
MLLVFLIARGLILLKGLSVTALAVTCLSPDLALPLTAPYGPASATRDRNRVYIGVLTSLTLSSSLLSLVSSLYRQNLQDQRLFTLH